MMRRSPGSTKAGDQSGFAELFESLEKLEGLDDHQFRIARAGIAALFDKPVEQCALLVLLVDAGVHQPVDPPRPFESEVRDIVTGHPSVLRLKKRGREARFEHEVATFSRMVSWKIA
jgi:hypothetical protein